MNHTIYAPIGTSNATLTTLEAAAAAHVGVAVTGSVLTNAVGLQPNAFPSVMDVGQVQGFVEEKKNLGKVV